MTRTKLGTQPKTSKTPLRLYANSTGNIWRSRHLKTSSMSTTTTVDTNEGWTFPGCSCPSEFPTTTEPDNKSTELPTCNETPNDRGIAASTTDGWGTPPAAPSPPLSAVGQPCTDDHTPLHWMACSDDYCNTHRQSKDNNYYPRPSRQATNCDYTLPHPNELLEVTHQRRLNPVKACADWHQGKWVCPECRFLVNIENHHLRCSAVALCTHLADVTPPQEDQEAAPAGYTPDPATGPITVATMTAALQDEQLTLLGEIVTMIHQTTTRDTPRNHVVHRILAQQMNEFHNADQQKLQLMANTLGAIITEQQRMNEQLQARQQASRPICIYHTPIRYRTLTTRHDLDGASV